MKDTFCVSMAGIPIEIASDSAFVKNFYVGYYTDAVPFFSVSASEEQIRAEIAASDEPTTPEYAEALCIYREIAEKLPLYHRLVFHGASVSFAGKAYLFTAPSGTGKSTHIRLWRKFLGEKVSIINGDKPILSFSDDGVIVHGTPYAGKEGWQANTSAPLAGICFLSQGKQNVIQKVLPKDCFTKLFLQTFKPYSEQAMVNTMEMVRQLCLLPCFSLSCDISENAVKCSFEQLTNQNYEVNRI